MWNSIVSSVVSRIDLKLPRVQFFIIKWPPPRQVTIGYPYVSSSLPKLKERADHLDLVVGQAHRQWQNILGPGFYDG